MKKINIAELLKNCPKGMELDCAIYEDVRFEEVRTGCPFPIKIIIDGHAELLTEYGCISYNENAKCVIFPKGKTTWEGFQRPFKNGDVVTWKDRGSLVACIYKERKNTASFNHHIALYKGGLGIVVNGEIALTDDELCLATEEEKQKLFDAIKANGYKWNLEIKTLEKLIEPKFKVGDRIKHKEGYFSGVVIKIGDESYKIKYDSNAICFANIKCQDDYKLVPNKFDISTLEPFDKVLVRDRDGLYWMADFYSHYLGKDKPYSFKCIGSTPKQCIPFEGNKHLLGKTDSCDDYYKTWE